MAFRISRSICKAELRAAVEEALVEKGVLGEHAGEEVLGRLNLPSFSGDETEGSCAARISSSWERCGKAGGCSVFHDYQHTGGSGAEAGHLSIQSLCCGVGQML